MISVNKVIERYPNIKPKLDDPHNLEVVLTNQEGLFYQLVRFFQDPSSVQFNLNSIYDYLQNEEIIFALEVIIDFFQRDTNLTRKVDKNFYNMHEVTKNPLYKQTTFVEKMDELVEGHKLSKPALHTLYRRGSDKIPNPILIIGGTPYWDEPTVVRYAKNYAREKGLTYKGE
ncbi:hypothetical protein [Terribacillus saccharophilus]|uniref:hypothetical protein n=1 Tax=Terribacillus saccharophilus TaxID=361277 RepID=UPI002989A729|nr:hypothetical protein [Terribacillus saccharophilus]MCM3227538.1 hypothetical protein [Terribacillus saccharophilus]